MNRERESIGVAESESEEAAPEAQSEEAEEQAPAMVAASELERERARANQSERERIALQQAVLDQRRADFAAPETAVSTQPPDPVEDPQAYARGIDAKNDQREAAFDQKLAQRDEANELRRQQDEIRNEFRREHPELAKSMNFVDAAFQDAYPSGNYGSDSPQTVVQRTAESARRMLDVLRPAEQPVTEQPNRTTVVRGSTATPKTGPRREPKTDADKPSDSMIDALRKRQQKAEYFTG